MPAQCPAQPLCAYKPACPAGCRVDCGRLLGPLRGRTHHLDDHRPGPPCPFHHILCQGQRLRCEYYHHQPPPCLQPRKYNNCAAGAGYHLRKRHGHNPQPQFGELDFGNILPFARVSVQGARRLELQKGAIELDGCLLIGVILACCGLGHLCYILLTCWSRILHKSSLAFVLSTALAQVPSVSAQH